MNIEQLQRFLVVADCLNFTTAAERLYVGQSTISRQIAALEQELGAVLLIRGPRSVELTEAGQLLQTDGIKLMAYIDRIKTRVQDAGNGSMGKLRITSLPAYFPVMDELYAKTAETYPEMRLSLEHSRYVNICQDLDTGNADIGLTYSFLHPGDPVYDVIPLYNEHFCVLCGKKHWIAQREGVYLDELRNENILFGRSGIQMHNSPQPYQGEPPVHDPTVGPSMESTFIQLQISDSIMILPHSSARRSETNLACVPLLDPDLIHQAILVYRKDSSSQALKRFLEIVRSYLSGAQEPDP